MLVSTSNVPGPDRQGATIPKSDPQRFNRLSWARRSSQNDTPYADTILEQGSSYGHHCSRVVVTREGIVFLEHPDGISTPAAALTPLETTDPVLQSVCS